MKETTIVTVKNEALEIAREFFAEFPLQKELTLPPGDYLLLYFWLRGFKVIPINDEVEE